MRPGIAAAIMAGALAMSNERQPSDAMIVEQARSEHRRREERERENAHIPERIARAAAKRERKNTKRRGLR